MDLSLITDDDILHYVYINDYNRFIFHKTKTKNKKYFFKNCLQCFNSKNVLTKHKEVRLGINGAQFVRLEKEVIEFKNDFKQIPVPFKIYADFESNLKSAENYEGSSFAQKLVSADDKFTKPIVVFRGKNAAYKFIEAILKGYECCKENNEKIL